MQPHAWWESNILWEALLTVAGFLEALVLYWLVRVEKATLRLEEADREWERRVEVVPAVITKPSQIATCLFQIANGSPAGICVSRLDVWAKRPEDASYQSRPCPAEEAAVIGSYSSVQPNALGTLRQLPNVFPSAQLNFPLPIHLYISVHFTAHGKHHQQDSCRYFAELTNNGYLQNLKEL